MAQRAFPKARRLSLVELERREVFSATIVDSLTTPYDPDHLLVRWDDGLAHSTPVSSSAEDLGAGIYLLTLTESVTEAIDYFKGVPGIDFVQPDYQLTSSAVPSDSKYTSQWALNNTGQNGGTAGADINVDAAWNYNTGSGKMIVAVIDTGIDYNHPDLAGNMWKNTDEIAGNGKDDDGNGFIDDMYGYDFANKDANPMDDNGHGTHVAGIIGAVGNNGTGVTGVNWDVQIMALKFLDKNNVGLMSNAVKAVNYAVANGAKVINNSYGSSAYDPAMVAAVKNAQSKGVIIVAAAGNNGRSNDKTPVYPANYNFDNIVSVAATDRNDNLASFSNYGSTSVDIAAPGASIYSTLKSNSYGSYSGTSMASPYVAGAIALVWDAHPTWTYKQVIEAVYKTVDKSSDLSGKVATGGRLNVGKAMTYTPSGTTSNPSTNTPTPTKPTSPTTTAGLRVTDVSFNGTTSNINQARVTFSSAVTVGSFTADDITLTGPDGKAIKITGVSPVVGTSNKQFLVTFGSFTQSGNYKLTIGSRIQGSDGKLLDQNQNGTRGESTDSYTTTYSKDAVAKTYSASAVNKKIGDLTTTISTLTISDKVSIKDLNVKLNLTHTSVKDLSISLIAPDGTKVILSLRRGGTGTNYTNTVFDDQASQSVWSAKAPFTGTFRPDYLLSKFNGKNAQGTWKLQIEDTSASHTGNLISWGLVINSSASASGSSIADEETAAIPADSATTIAVSDSTNEVDMSGLITSTTPWELPPEWEEVEIDLPTPILEQQEPLAPVPTLKEVSLEGIEFSESETELGLVEEAIEL